MTDLIKDTFFSSNKNMQKSIVKKLNHYSIIYIDDLTVIDSYDLFKIRSFGYGKVMLVQEMMKRNNVKFKNDIYTKIIGSRYNDKFLLKHGVIDV